MSTDPDATTNFGPYLRGVGPQIPGEPEGTLLRYGVIEDVEKHSPMPVIKLLLSYWNQFKVKPVLLFHQKITCQESRVV